MDAATLNEAIPLVPWQRSFRCRDVNRSPELGGIYKLDILGTGSSLKSMAFTGIMTSETIFSCTIKAMLGSRRCGLWSGCYLCL
jgi:hypothetical protein